MVHFEEKRGGTIQWEELDGGGGPKAYSNAYCCTTNERNSPGKRDFFWEMKLCSFFSASFARIVIVLARPIGSTC